MLCDLSCWFRKIIEIMNKPSLLGTKQSVYLHLLDCVVPRNDVPFVFVARNNGIYLSFQIQINRFHSCIYM